MLDDSESASVLRRLVDHEAIRDLFSRYCVYMDTGRFTELACLFTADGVWNGVVGHTAIAERLASIIPLPEEGPRRIHALSNVLISVDGSIATATSNWIVVRETPTGAGLGAAGRYQDDLLKLDGRWYFQRRIISEEISGDLGLKPTLFDR